MPFNPLRSILKGKNVCHAQAKNTLQRDHCLSLSLSTHSYYYYYTALPPPVFICSVLSSFLPSLLIRMGHVLVGRGRRQCPSAAACQRRRSAVLQTASTPWWVSYSVALYIKYTFYIPLHEIFNVQCACI